MQSDHDRRELYLALHDLLGPGPAGTLMELLPPVGWPELVRTSDLERGLASIRGEIAELRGEMAAQVPRFVLATVPLVLGTAGLVLAATKLA